MAGSQQGTADNGDSPHVEVTCDACGESFEKYRFDVTDNNFCSNECQGDFRRERVEVACSNCGETLERKPSQVERSERYFCDTGCVNEWRAETSNGGLVGDNHPGRIGGESRDCAVCGDTFTYDPFNGNYREKYCSDGCFSEAISKQNRSHLSRYWSGSDNPRWDGGKESYYGPNFQSQRERVISRDGGCAVCGMGRDTHIERFGTDIHVHHDTPLKWFKERFREPWWYFLANRDANLTTLCREHHRKVDENLGGNDG